VSDVRTTLRNLSGAIMMAGFAGMLAGVVTAEVFAARVGLLIMGAGCILFLFVRSKP